MIERHNADSLVVREAPFSHITDTGDVVYLAGIIAADDADGGDSPESITAQTTICLDLIGKLLAQVGLDYQHIATVLVHMVDLTEFDAMNAAYAQYFPAGAQPVRTCVGVASLLADAKIEITCVAHRPGAVSAAA